MSTIKPGLFNVFLKKFDKPMIVKYLKSIKQKEFNIDTAEIEKRKHTTHAYKNFQPVISHQADEGCKAKKEPEEKKDINEIMK